MNHAQQDFAEQYAKHVDEIYRYVFFHVRQHRETAEDVTNDVFLKAWKQAKRYDSSRASFRTFLFRIAHSVVIDHWRTQRTPVEELSEDVAGPSQAPAQTDIQLFWQSANRTLQPHVYEMLVLKYRHGFSIVEIAAVLGTTEAAVKSQLQRARAALEELFIRKDESL